MQSLGAKVSTTFAKGDGPTHSMTSFAQGLVAMAGTLNPNSGGPAVQGSVARALTDFGRRPCPISEAWQKERHYDCHRCTLAQMQIVCDIKPRSVGRLHPPRHDIKSLASTHSLNENVSAHRRGTATSLSSGMMPKSDGPNHNSFG